MNNARTASAPVIGLTTYGTNAEGRYDLPGNYVKAVRHVGGIPLLIPPGDRQWRRLLPLFDAIILSGGGDINPQCYDGATHPTVYNVDDERDHSELELARHALAAELPTLAICRGAQILNVAAGGSLHPHLIDHYGDAVQHRLPPHKPIPHPVTVDTNSTLHRILGTSAFTSQSWHHQAFRDIPPPFQPVAWAPDGVVEAIESPTHPFLIAVQWHPELSVPGDEVQERLFRAVVEAGGGF